MKILVLNSGSSSCKLSLFDLENGHLPNPQNPIWETNLPTSDAQGKNSYDNMIGDRLNDMPVPLETIDAVGHRIVHGGNQFSQPIIITPEAIQAIKQLTPLAPLHIPQHLSDIALVEKLIPKTVQIAVFDTAFHTTLSEAAHTYAGPYSWKEQGIKRYGFHGISYEYCSARCALLLNREDLNIVCCHLGNGASIAAISHQLSVDTTMGFTPLEGLMMGSRCGSIDPGILIYLSQQCQQSSEDLYQTMYHNSGLKGISGASGDMREIIRLRAENDPKAILGFDMYIHSLKKNIGSMIAVLDELDVLIFTGGVGENSPLVRQAACGGMKHLGIILNEEKNRQSQGDAIISSNNSDVHILVIATKEEWCIACTILDMIH